MNVTHAETDTVSCSFFFPLLCKSKSFVFVVIGDDFCNRNRDNSGLNIAHSLSLLCATMIINISLVYGQTLLTQCAASYWIRLDWIGLSTIKQTNYH